VAHVWGIVVILGKPKSRGVVRLRSREAREPALVDPRYFSSGEDLETMVQAVARARAVARAEPLRAWGNFELMPGARVTAPEKIADFIRKNVMTTYHFSGTCKLGAGADSVVDGELRVRGVRGLRVADASVIPAAPVSAMNAPSMLIGYRAAALVRAGLARGADVELRTPCAAQSPI
jgi:choline dehydrogenase